MVWRAYIIDRIPSRQKIAQSPPDRAETSLALKRTRPPAVRAYAERNYHHAWRVVQTAKKNSTVRCHLVEGSSMHTGVLVPLTSVTKYLIGGCYSVIEQTMALPKSSSGHFIHDISVLPNALLHSKAFPTRNSSHSMIRRLVWNSSYYTACM